MDSMSRISMKRSTINMCLSPNNIFVAKKGGPVYYLSPSILQGLCLFLSSLNSIYFYLFIFSTFYVVLFSYFKCYSSQKVESGQTLCIERKKKKCGQTCPKNPLLALEIDHKDSKSFMAANFLHLFS